MERKCKVCNQTIHPKRVALGYPDTCVNHSTAARYTGLVVADGKSGDQIQVIKDPEIGKKLVGLSNVY